MVKIYNIKLLLSFYYIYINIFLNVGPPKESIFLTTFEGSFWGIFLGLNFKSEFLKKVLSLIVRILIYYFNGSSNASNY